MADPANLVFHGTSLVQYEKLRADGFATKMDLYVGDSRENITDHYAEKQAKLDHSIPATIVFDAEKLLRLQDIHYFVDGSGEEQAGQWTVSGFLADAIVSASALTDAAGEVELPTKPGDPLPDDAQLAEPSP